MTKVKQVVQKVTNSLGYQISKLRQPIEYPYIDILDLIIKDYLAKEKELFFIQIGANDGVTADPISHLVKKFHWNGILVEPQPHVFKKLVENYRDEEQLVFENSAVCNQDGTITLYAISEKITGLPMWCYQIANLDRNRILNLLADQKNKLNLPQNIETFVEAIPLSALTFRTLLSKYHVKKVDLLVIDTLGYDFEIIKMIPLDVIKPPIIHFEHALLPLDEQEECFNYLAGLGYSFAQVSVDTIAYLHGQKRLGLFSL